jgi:hypothetical protein
LHTIFLRYPDGAGALPECWLYHPDVVEELTWLLATHGGGDAPAATAQPQPRPFSLPRSAQPLYSPLRPMFNVPLSNVQLFNASLFNSRRRGLFNRSGRPVFSQLTRVQRWRRRRLTGPQDGRDRPPRRTGRGWPLRGTPTAIAASPPSPSWRPRPMCPAGPPRRSSSSSAPSRHPCT